MKLWAGVLGAAGALSGFVLRPALTEPTEKPWVVMIGGNTQGYLSPCGCTKPMAGGIRRRTQAVRALTEAARTVYLDSGSFVGDRGRQDELKAQTMAQALGKTQISAVNLTRLDANLGPGNLSTLEDLSGGRIISGSIEPISSVSVAPSIAAGPFVIGGLSSAPEAVAEPLGAQSVPLEEGARRLLASAGPRPAVVLFDGDESAARMLALQHPLLKLIIYRSESDPPLIPIRVGRTLLVTPGEHGKHLIRLSFFKGQFPSYSVIKLGPEFADDPSTDRIYRAYLRRVDDEDLLARVPRDPGPRFSGNDRCGSCHAKALAVWKTSAHFRALHTLEADGHGRDPDCVSCHVTGLNVTTGFRSRMATPHLTDVGCESCHGAGENHSVSPLTVKLPTVGGESCASCHTVSQSPTFDFLTYWRKISH